MLKVLRACAIAGLLASATFANAPAMAGNETPAVDRSKQSRSIVEIAVGDANLSTLVTALTKANLVTTLEGNGPFTVFAPTNAAFAEIPPAILDYLLANPPVLKEVLLYHVAAGEHVLDFDLLPAPLATVQGENVWVHSGNPFTATSITINNSNVIANPIAAANGIIYVIDSVLQPQFR
jgi:uncharacterized surface protein with fasciclin (FAS1) repeats